MTPRRLIEPARLAGSTLLRTQSDTRLVDLVRAGHAAAFEAIVHRYRRPLLAYCSRVLPASRAEDAVQQTFVSAHQAMTRGEGDLNLRPWLYRIARNASLNLLRQNGWAHDELGENLDGVERPDEALERSEQLRSAVAAVNALPARQRDALVQRELEGKRYDEIAASMGVADGAVRQLLHRARATLRAGASALTPVGLLERIADLAGGVGVGGGVGAAKLGAALLATGAVAGGTLATPIARHHHPQPRVRAAAAPHRAKPRPAQTVVHVTAPVVHRRGAVLQHREIRKPVHSKHRGGGNSGPGNAGEDDPVEQEHSGDGHSGKGGGERRDSDDTVTAPSSAPSVDNSGPGSVSSGDGHSGSGDGGSGSGGSGSGSSGSGSGSSGSGSGSSGSGSSGSGAGSSGSGSSGGDSGVSGSDGSDDGH